MNSEDKNKLNHDFINSAVIINSLSKSAISFIDKITDKNTTVTDNQIKLFKNAMLSIQKEMSIIKGLFQESLNK